MCVRYFERNRIMKKQCAVLLGVILVAGSAMGCLSRTNVSAGPVNIEGQAQVLDKPAPSSIDLTLERGGFTFWRFDCWLEGSWMPCEKVISVNHSTGDPDKVRTDVPFPGDDSE